jgi:hypothetical protein
MSVQKLEQQVRELPPAQLREFAEWWAAEGDNLLLAAHPESETEAMKAELLRRQEEYRDHPERFARMDDANLKRMFDRIADARARLSSTR